MEQPKGVSDHPAKEQMEQFWRLGHRATWIAEWLAAEGQPVLGVKTIARYGQRYWNDKIVVDLEGQNPEVLADLLEDIAEADIGTVSKISFTRKRYPGWDKVDGQSIPVEKESVAQSVEVIPYRESPFKPANIAPINISLSTEAHEGKPEGLNYAIVVPDQQFGYHLDVDGNTTTTHDEAAINVFHQVLGAAEAAYGVDLVVNLGDALDLPGFSHHRSAPGFCSPATTQLAIDRFGTEVATQRALTEAMIIAFNGNHENRLNNAVIDKLPNLHAISKANSRDAVLSIASLCRFDEYNILGIDTYPDGVFWANDYLKFKHGDTASGALGATAAKHLNGQTVSTVYGHIHRQELLNTTVESKNGARNIFAGSPGCLCRIDGVLPSGQTGVKSSGGQAGVKRERWQHGLFEIWYETDGLQRAWCSSILIEDGTTVYRGKRFIAQVDSNGEPLHFD